ncbi:glycosyltransferase family protein [Cognaticolwellia mytili]|uniref:hypothetical protein n=1 Tax=Cognaticolwellia mytili TaxID=1888913 RepID=UPI000A16E072|nr:hypothetical protein [Cognaticolwellia mytili]
MANVNIAAQLEKTCSKYLAHYAEQEVASLVSFPKQFDYQHVLVIPAFQESVQFIERFIASSLAEQQCLLIVVVNQPDSDFGQQHSQVQVDLERDILALGLMLWQQDNLRLVSLVNSSINPQSNSAVLLVNRYTQPIPAEQGVGLARKIGADLAADLFLRGRIVSPWIHSSDADAHLPDNYFSAHSTENIAVTHLVEAKIAVATCCNFYHHSEQPKIHQANKLYETALRYYVAGLHFAQSPYAYFTIGSILSFDIYAYCQVRGFPKRSAGEDFYLLNKLAKLGTVLYIPEVTIKLDARPSERVPFGTGPAVKSIITLTEQARDYTYYNPKVFIELKTCLLAFDSLWQYRDEPQIWLKFLPTITQQALENIGVLSFITKQQKASKAQFDKQLIVWFDSFKTLKFIHALRELGLNNIPLEQALAKAPF